MKIYVRGSSLSAYMCCLLLDLSEIYFDRSSYKDETLFSDILSIKIKDLSDSQLRFLRSKIDFLDCIETRSAGFLYKNKIYDHASEEMSISYLKKQGRKYDKNTFQFESSYQAINLIKLINKIKLNIDVLNEDRIPETDCIEIRTNIQVEKPNDSKEYIRYQFNDLGEYNYIYDCNEDSNQKRICKNFVELISKEENSKELPNYYSKPEMYISYDFRNNKYIIYLGRFATKTRIEQKEIIKACEIIKKLTERI